MVESSYTNYKRKHSVYILSIKPWGFRYDQINPKYAGKQVFDNLTVKTQVDPSVKYLIADDFEGTDGRYYAEFYATIDDHEDAKKWLDYILYQHSTRGINISVIDDRPPPFQKDPIRWDTFVGDLAWEGDLDVDAVRKKTSDPEYEWCKEFSFEGGAYKKTYKGYSYEDPFGADWFKEFMNSYGRRHQEQQQKYYEKGDQSSGYGYQSSGPTGYQTSKAYRTLGVHPTATQDEIKKAYRKLAMEHHPDKGGDPQKMKEINEAYNILKK